MSDSDYDRLREEGRERARSTAIWDARYCTKEYWVYQMSIIPHDAIGADLTKHAPHGSYSPMFWYRAEWFSCRDCGKSEKWTAVMRGSGWWSIALTPPRWLAWPSDKNRCERQYFRWRPAHRS